MRRAFWIVILFSLAINLLMLTAPLFMLQVYDRVLSSRSTDTLAMLLIMALIALLTLAALDYLRGVALARIGAWMDRQLGTVLFAESVSASLNGPVKSAQALRDLVTVRSFLGGPMVVPLLDTPWTPIFLAVLFLLHPLLGWVALGGALTLFVFAVLNDVLTRRLIRHSAQAQIDAARVAESAIRNSDVIMAMGLLPGLVERWRDRAENAVSRQTRAGERNALLGALSKFMRFALQIGILALGALLVLDQQMTAGGIVAGAILMGRALAPLEQAIGAWRMGVEAREAYIRIKRQLDNAHLRVAQLTLPKPKGRITVEGASFAYSGQPKLALRGINFTLNPGDGLGIIGSTASGKTTLARMLIGNLAPRTGAVRLDGADLSKWDPASRGRHIGYLPQTVELFEGTVRENIARFSDADDKDVVAAAQRAGVHDMILHLPQGYETQLGENGMVLSGGQKQRVGLARALFGNPCFVVLDEPNANLDIDGEQALIAALAALRRDGATVVVVAHRPTVLRAMDKVLVLKDGAMQAFGARDEVLRKVLGPALHEGRSRLEKDTPPREASSS